MEHRQRNARCRALLRRGWVPALLWSVAAGLGCTPVDEVCIDQNVQYQKPSCGAQLCYPGDPPLLLDEAGDPNAALVCTGCDTTGAQSTLSGSGGTGAKTYTVSMTLAGSWDRTFSAASLNAALARGSLSTMGFEQDSDGRTVTVGGFSILPGDITDAKLSAGRLTLTMRPHLSGSLVAPPSGPCSPLPYCACMYGNNDGKTTPQRPITLVLPLRGVAGSSGSP